MTTTIPVADVTIPAHRMRAVRPGVVVEIAESLKRNGLLSPIVVTEDHVLVDGAHRLAAADSIGWKNIEAKIIKLAAGSLEATLAEIDANLMRAELTELERGEHLARRKEVYEALWPETKQGATGRGGKKLPTSRNLSSGVIPRSFVSEASDLTGKGTSGIYESIKVGKMPAEVRDALRGTPIADRTRDLVELAKMDPDTQAKAVAAIVATKARSLAETGVRRRAAAEDARPGADTPAGQRRGPTLDAVLRFVGECDSMHNVQLVHAEAAKRLAEMRAKMAGGMFQTRPAV